MWISASRIVRLLWFHGDRAELMAEEREHDVHFVHAKRWLVLFQFADEAQADPGAVGQVSLGQMVLLTLLADKFGKFHGVIPVRGGSW